MKAILLAGGLGTRLRPITLTCPKPLLPIGNTPLIQWIVLNLRAQGIKEFVFLLYYQPENFIQALGDGAIYGVTFTHLIMKSDLSTAGSVKFAREHITGTTLIYSADILAEIHLHRMLAFHQQRRALVTLALHPISAPLPFGLVLRESDGRIRRFFEKPTWPQVFSDWINAGIYLIEPALLDHIPDNGRPIFFEQEVFPPLAAANEAIYGFPLQGYWRDVGTPEDLRMANLDYLHGRLSPPMLADGESMSTIASPSENASHAPLIVAGSGGEISPAAHVKECVVGSNCKIAPHAQLRGTVVFDQVCIGAGAQVNDAIIMREVEIEAQAEIHHGAVLAEGSRIGATAVIEANAVVRNRQIIAAGERVVAKRVLPIGYLRRFVDGGSLLGSVAGGMSADFMRWVGKAFAQKQQRAEGRGQRAAPPLLLATEEGERFLVWIRALAQGMLSAGSEVHLLEEVTLPVARWTLQKGRHTGGLYLGIDTNSGLLRLALLHPSGEDFTTEESCSLERVDLTDAAVPGNMRILDALRLREDYLRMVINATAAQPEPQSLGTFPQLKGSVLDRPVLARLGVIGKATEQIATKFFNMLGWPVRIEMFPLDMYMSSDYRRHLRNMQKTFAESVNDEVGIGVWLGGVGERLQLVLPDRGILPYGQSDVTIACLLMKEIPEAKLVSGWLFPHKEQSSLCPSLSAHGLAPAAPRRYDGCMLSAESLRIRANESLIVGFDGRGAVAISQTAISNSLARPKADIQQNLQSSIIYPDSLLTLAFLFLALSKTTRSELGAMVPNVALGYRLLPCPDEAKAYLMRRLVEAYDQLDFTFSDGIRLEDRSQPSANSSPNWVVVRPCAGKQALEIFWEKNEHPPSLSVSVRRRLALWLRSQNFQLEKPERASEE